MISRATKKDVLIISQLAIMMWEDNTIESLSEELSKIINNEDSVIFLTLIENVAIGFAQCQLRYDYVEGTEGSPVGYLEGIFVKQEHRKHGHAKELLCRCEQWAKDQGCKEFASDCELDNETSLEFHMKMGFAEANRIICFTKQI